MISFMGSEVTDKNIECFDKKGNFGMIKMVNVGR